MSINHCYCCYCYNTATASVTAIAATATTATIIIILLLLPLLPFLLMMTSSNGNIFRATGHLCEEFTGPGEFPAQKPVTRSFGFFFFYLSLNKRLSKQSRVWWFETQSRPLWRHCNVLSLPLLLLLRLIPPQHFHYHYHHYYHCLSLLLPDVVLSLKGAYLQMKWMVGCIYVIHVSVSSEEIIKSRHQ